MIMLTMTITVIMKTIKMTTMVMTMMTITIMMTTKTMAGKIMKTFTTMTFTVVMTKITTTKTASILTMIISFLFLALPTQTPFPYAFDDNKFFAMWRFDDQADKIHVHLRVKTTGWIGFGFAQTAPNDMRDYDVIVGGFSNGRGYLWVSSSFFFNSRALRQGQRETGDDLGCHGPHGLYRYELFLNKSFHSFTSKATGLSPCCRFFTHKQNRPS